MARFSIETINDYVSMIDIELFGIKRVGAVFLIKGNLTCLVDSGSKKDQSWNSLYDEKQKFENITSVDALKNGQIDI